MKKISRAILLAALGLAFVPTVKATSGYDLLVGFTQSGGNTSGDDLIVDLGPVNAYPGATGLSNGETWDLSTLLSGQGFNLSSVQWGVLGDANGNDGASVSTLWVTTSGTMAPAGIANNSVFSFMDNSVNAIEQDFSATPNYQSYQGQTTTIVEGNQNSWDQQTISGTLSTQFVNAYGNPNVTGETSDTLWQVPEGSSATDLGSFSLNSAGVLTFNAVPEPGTLGLLSIGGLLVLAWRYRFNSNKA